MAPHLGSLLATAVSLLSLCDGRKVTVASLRATSGAVAKQMVAAGELDYEV